MKNVISRAGFRSLERVPICLGLFCFMCMLAVRAALLFDYCQINPSWRKATGINFLKHKFPAFHLNNSRTHEYNPLK